VGSATPPAPATAESAAPTAPRVTTDTRSPNVRVHCPEVGETPERIWEDGLEQRLDANLAGLRACSASLSKEVTLTLLLSYRKNGSPKSQVVLASTADDCRVFDCVKRQLGKVRASVFPGSYDPAQILVLGLKPDAASWLADVDPSLGEPPKTQCLEGTPSEREGRLPPEEIRRIARSHYGELRQCYEGALGRDPNATGKIVTLFVIGLDGKMTSVRIAYTTLPDCEAVRCMREVYKAMVFPRPEGGRVTVIYPITFDPG
jgi:hypothetical protein